MRRYLLVALWPVGVAAIGAATIKAARRAARAGAPRAASAPRPGLASIGKLAAPLALVDGAGGLGSGLARVIGGTAASRVAGLAGEARGGQSAAAGEPAGLAGQRDWLPELIRLGAVSYAGGALSYGVMRLLGPTVVNRGPAIDEPIVAWTSSHQVDWWAAIMERLGKIGNTWTTWGAAGTAAVCLAVSWPSRKWLPPAVLGAAILVDHYATLALRHKFGRPGPPGSPGGTYPSGGCDRVVLFYGLIGYLLWREFSGSPRGQVWAVGTVAALSFNEAYSRQYLSKHWFTDIISGLVYGAVLLGPFIAAVRLIAGPPGPQRPALGAG